MIPKLSFVGYMQNVMCGLKLMTHLTLKHVSEIVKHADGSPMLCGHLYSGSWTDDGKMNVVTGKTTGKIILEEKLLVIV